MINTTTIKDWLDDPTAPPLIYHQGNLVAAAARWSRIAKAATMLAEAAGWPEKILEGWEWEPARIHLTQRRHASGDYDYIATHAIVDEPVAKYVPKYFGKASKWRH